MDITLVSGRTVTPVLLGGTKRKMWGHGPHRGGNPQPSTVIFFDAIKVSVYVHHIQDCGGQDCVPV